MDKITLDRIAIAHPSERSNLTNIYKKICDAVNSKYVQIRFASTLRTDAEQAETYAQGRTKPGAIVSYSKAGESWHNYGLAVDIVFLIDKDKNGSFESASWEFFKDYDGDGKIDFDEIDMIFKNYGYKGLYKADGKRWDFPHFQNTKGLTIAKLLDMRAKKLFIPGTTYIQI